MAINEEKPQEPNKDQWQADRRIYLDQEGNVVEADNPKKHSLLVAEGLFLPIAVAEQYGLTKAKPAKKEAEAEAPKAETKPAAKKSK